MQSISKTQYSIFKHVTHTQTKTLKSLLYKELELLRSFLKPTLSLSLSLSLSHTHTHTDTRTHICQICLVCFCGNVQMRCEVSWDTHTHTHTHTDHGGNSEIARDTWQHWHGIPLTPPPQRQRRGVDKWHLSRTERNGEGEMVFPLSSYGVCVCKWVGETEKERDSVCLWHSVYVHKYRLECACVYVHVCKSVCVSEWEIMWPSRQDQSDNIPEHSSSQPDYSKVNRV